MTLKLIDDCFVLDKDRIAHHEALAILKSRVRRTVDSESVPLDEAAGRFLAETLVSPRPIPAHDNTAVDGYAFAHSTYNKEKGARLIVAGEASAGHPFQTVPSLGTAIRIFTGAVMPSGLDTVVMQEDVRIEPIGDERWVHIPPGLKQGANRRLAGEELQARRLYSLRPAHDFGRRKLRRQPPPGLIGFAAMHRSRLPLSRPGTRSCGLGEAFAPGKVYDANAPMLEGTHRGGRCRGGEFRHLAGQGRTGARGPLRGKPTNTTPSLFQAGRAKALRIML